METPEDVEREIGRSREFSKLIKKKCGSQAPGTAAQTIPTDKKLKMDELLQLQRESLEEYFIITPEMIALNDYVAKS